MVVIGVDPGSQFAGLAVLKKSKQSMEILALDFIEVPEKLSIDEKLFFVASSFEKLLLEFSPQYIALEESFVGKNVQSTLRLSEIRGAISYLSMKSNIPVLHLSTRKVKKSITGNGNASKDQVAFYLKNEFQLEQALPLDVTDALALAYHACLGS